MRGIRLKDYLLGYTAIETNASETEIIDTLFKIGVAYRTVQMSGDRLILICTSGRKRIKQLLLDKEKYKVSVGGIPQYLLCNANRVGLWLGIIVCLAVLYISSSLVWDVEVFGNERLSDDFVKNVLTDYGLKSGVFRRNVDLDSLHQEVLLDNGNIGWLRVNFRGSVAIVEVIEYEGEASNSKTAVGSNLVASRDALVLSVESKNGTSAVKAGDTVRAGELLIGGISDSNIHGYKVYNAEGIVIGEVFDEIAIKIPYEFNQKSYTGVSFTEKSIQILGKEIKLSKNCGNYGDNYDIIEKKKRLEPFDMIKLPIVVRELTYNEYKNRVFTLNAEQATELAKAELSDRLSRFSDAGDIIGISTETVLSDNSVTINAKIHRTEDICKRILLPSSGD